MTGVLYFSSTGNSLYIAKKIKEKFNSQVRYIPKYNGDGSEFETIFIVTPVYSFGLPVPVSDILPKLNGKTEIIVIQNYGGMKGNADRLFYEYALGYNLNIRSVYAIKMPENFTLVMSPPHFYSNRILQTADKRIAEILDAIENKRYVLPKNKSTREKTYLKNRNNWHLIGGRFSTNDKCIKCNKCVNLCPADNISLVKGEIKFADKCVACLGCFHRCPQNAIIYKNKDNKKRYLNPNVVETEIGKDL